MPNSRRVKTFCTRLKTLEKILLKELKDHYWMLTLEPIHLLPPPTTAGACTGLGIAPNKIKEVFGIFVPILPEVGTFSN